jgi:hypothetical protein
MIERARKIYEPFETFFCDGINTVRKFYYFSTGLWITAIKTLKPLNLKFPYG